MAQSRLFLLLAALLGASAMGMGAFATHSLRPQLSDRLLAIFETAARYQMYHALALLLVALLVTVVDGPSPWLTAAGWCFVAGVAVFSGSLYALSLTGISVLGAITPLGGLGLIGGWLCLAMAAFTTEALT